MNRTLTTFLVWLLMAVLPLHAVAAAASASCVPPAQSVSMADHASRLALDEAHAHHDGHEVAKAAADSGHDGHHAEANKSGHSSCSACSAFCAGAVAPPSFSLPLPTFSGSEPVIVPRADFVAGFIPDGLQRPPRQ